MFKAERLIKRQARASDIDSVKVRKKELHIKDKDVELLTRCEHLWMNFDEFREQRRRGNRFYDGDQWGDLITVNGKTMTYREYLSSTGNVVIQTNQIKNRVDTIVGVMVKEKSEPVCHAIDRDEQTYGEIMTNALQANCIKNIMPELYIKWMKDLCNGGLSVSYESYDDHSGPERRLDSWTQYVNPNRIFFDGDCVDPRMWDLSIIGCVRYGSREDICAQFVKSPSDYESLKKIYPNQFSVVRSERVGDVNDKIEDKRLTFMDSSDPALCYYVEVWTKESTPRIRLNDTNEGTEEIIDADDRAYRAQIKAENERRKKLAQQLGWDEDSVPYIIGDGYGSDENERSGFFVDTYWYCRFLAPDGTILWEGESPYANKAHPFSLCVFSYIDGHIVGYTHDAIDHNMAMNRAFITNEWLTRTQAKGVTVVPKAIVPADVSYEDFARSWTAIDDLVFIDLKPGQEGLMPKTFYGAAQNYNVAQLIGTIQNLMESGSPVNGALQGKAPSSGTSGTLYAQMTTNAATPVAALMEQFHNFVIAVLNKKMKNIALFYDAGRFEKIAGQSESLIDPESLNLNEVGDLEYDLRIVESADTPVFREMQENDLLLFLQAGFISFEEYLEASGKPYVGRLLQKRQARQAEMEAMQQEGIEPTQQTGMPVGAAPEAVPVPEAPAAAEGPLQRLPVGLE